MNKLVCLFSVLFALNAVQGSELSSYVYNVLSEDTSIASSVLSEINAETTFSGPFSQYVSEVDSMISNLLDGSTISTETESSTTSIKTTTSNAAAGDHGKNVAGVLALVMAAMGFMMAF